MMSFLVSCAILAVLIRLSVTVRLHIGVDYFMACWGIIYDGYESIALAGIKARFPRAQPTPLVIIDAVTVAMAFVITIVEAFGRLQDNRGGSYEPIHDPRTAPFKDIAFILIIVLGALHLASLVYNFLDRYRHKAYEKEKAEAGIAIAKFKESHDLEAARRQKAVAPNFERPETGSSSQAAPDGYPVK
jgi:hypothetical protein